MGVQESLQGVEIQWGRHLEASKWRLGGRRLGRRAMQHISPLLQTLGREGWECQWHPQTLGDPSSIHPNPSAHMLWGIWACQPHTSTNTLHPTSSAPMAEGGVHPIHLDGWGPWGHMPYEVGGLMPTPTLPLQKDCQRQSIMDSEGGHEAFRDPWSRKKNLPSGVGVV